MNKCDCYHIETIRHYTYNPVTGNPIGHDIDVGVCWGTKECEECSCGGDKIKCDFYPEIRQKARKERKPKFGKWISVEDRLPERDQGCLLCIKNEFTDYRWIELGYYQKDKNITHWQPLPELPKGE